jgi:signal transduction histidine kinase
MFHSATLKLTGWYLAIVVIICLLFSIVIYSIATHEISSRLTSDQSNTPQALRILDPTLLDTIRMTQIHEAEANLIYSLAITNILIWTAGGIGSYYLARRTLEPIEHAHDTQSRFTSDASHELRTPLASMKAELEVALRDPRLSKHEMREILLSNLEEVNKLTRLSHTLLQLSRLDHANIEHGPVNINAELETILTRFSEQKDRVRYDSSPQIEVIANQSAVEELLTIFIDNALKYSPPGSPVTIKWLRQKQFSGFEISNEGEGISAEMMPRIFDRFYRADDSRTNGSKRGYGLGLSLAKKLVELHGGELTVTSQPGSLTTFRILLPNLK